MSEILAQSALLETTRAYKNGLPLTKTHEDMSIENKLVARSRFGKAYELEVPEARVELIMNLKNLIST